MPAEWFGRRGQQVTAAERVQREVDCRRLWDQGNDQFTIAEKLGYRPEVVRAALYRSGVPYDAVQSRPQVFYRVCSNPSCGKTYTVGKGGMGHQRGVDRRRFCTKECGANFVSDRLRAERKARNEQDKEAHAAKIRHRNKMFVLQIRKAAEEFIEQERREQFRKQIKEEG